MQCQLNSVLIAVFHIAMQLSNETEAFQRGQQRWSEKKAPKTHPQKKKNKIHDCIISGRWESVWASRKKFRIFLLFFDAFSQSL